MQRREALLLISVIYYLDSRFAHPGLNNTQTGQSGRKEEQQHQNMVKSSKNRFVTCGWLENVQIVYGVCVHGWPAHVCFCRRKLSFTVLHETLNK